MLAGGDESIVEEKTKRILVAELEKEYVLKISDTDVNDNRNYYLTHKEEVVRKKIEEFRNCSVIITDRFHGVVFSLIARRPVVVLKTSGHKVSAMIEWFSEEWKQYIYFVENPNNVKEILYGFKKMNCQKVKIEDEKYFERQFNEMYEKIESSKNFRSQKLKSLRRENDTYE